MDADVGGKPSSDLKTWAIVVYALYLGGFVTGISPIVGLILAYVKKAEATPPWDGHLAFQIRTFWIGLLFGVIGVVLSFIFIGVLVLFAVAIWWLARVVIGLVKALSDEPIPQPRSWLLGL